MSDLISRQAVLSLPRDVTRNLKGDIVEESIDVEDIKALPSEDRPTGKWIFDNVGYFHCSICEEKPNDQTAFTKFCPNCGTKMEVQDE